LDWLTIVNAGVGRYIAVSGLKGICSHGCIVV
jgi:hypothetical protein